MKKDSKVAKKPLISIIVPVYNIARYLEKCIVSICVQTYTKLEIILVDDGSTDLSGKICDRFAAKDSRIRVIHKDNGGLVSARKAGLDIAHGEFIAFVDGDDWIEPDMYKTLVKIICERDCDFVESGFISENIDNENVTIHEVETAIYDVSPETKIQLIKNWVMEPQLPALQSTIWSKVYRSEIIKESYKNVPDNMNLGEDKLSFLFLFQYTRKIAVINFAYYHYRIRMDSLSHGNRISDFIQTSNLLNTCYKILREQFIDLDIEIIDGWYYKKIMAEFRKLRISENMKEIVSIGELKNQRIVLYGAGIVGTRLYKRLQSDTTINIVGWLDKYKEKSDCPEGRFFDFYEINNVIYDKILIAIKNPQIALDVLHDLIEYGCNAENIYWCISLEDQV